MQYFVLPHCCIAFNAKVASSALASAIVRKHHSDRLKKAMDDYERNWSQFSDEFKASLPESFQRMFRCDMNDSISFWQNLCTITNKPELPVLLLFRHPVERFVSGAAYLSQNVDRLLTGLETDDHQYVMETTPIRISRNTHFIKQSWLITENTKVYRFPEQLKEMCLEAELEYPLPRINEGKLSKPSLTEEQIKRIESYYFEDMELWRRLIV